MRISTLALLASIAAAPAHADTVLPAAIANIRLLPGGTTYTTYGGFSPSGTLQTYSLSDFGATLTANNLAGTDPQVSSSIVFSGSPTTQEQFEAISQVIYYFEVTGPVNQTASVDIAGSGAASLVGVLAGGFAAYANLSIGNTATGATILSETASASSPGVPTAGFNVNETLNLLTNTPYLVNMDARSQLTVNSFRSGSFTASSSIDPTITLDTSDPAYSLEFSPGLLGSSPTPEPSSIVLLGTGIAGLAFVTWRR